ncbi:hypothetical protein [Halopseudomonas litoralis]|uniref:hypothetical protein n=1 Tax=Halopseudomonas litoralis TaxID=797277 RepID=UPI0012FD13C7|nr:hypothetical protein [Halopseudomonas litoralis]
MSWRTGVTTAASDMLNVSVTGCQGHGGMPWNTIDPIVASAQISIEPMYSTTIKNQGKAGLTQPAPFIHSQKS